MSYLKKVKMEEIEENLSSENFDPNFFQENVSYYAELLDEDYVSNQYDYVHEVAFLKGLGYRIFRNSKGKHMLKYEDYIELT